MTVHQQEEWNTITTMYQGSAGDEEYNSDNRKLCCHGVFCAGVVWSWKWVLLAGGSVT